MIRIESQRGRRSHAALYHQLLVRERRFRRRREGERRAPLFLRLFLRLGHGSVCGLLVVVVVAVDALKDELWMRLCVLLLRQQFATQLLANVVIGLLRGRQRNKPGSDGERRGEGRGKAWVPEEATEAVTKQDKNNEIERVIETQLH